MTSIPESSELTEDERDTVGLGNPPVLADPKDTVLSGRALIKTFGRVVGLDGVDVDLFPGEILAVIGDNGAGKSTLIKALTGALIPDSGQVFLDGQEVHFKTPQDARGSGIETVQNMGQAVETLSGGQRQAVAVARAATFATKFVVLDEPTAALGVKETGQVLNLIQEIKARGLPVILISHNMPNVFEVSDRIHIARLGGCAGVITPKSHTPTEAVAIMTGATTLQKG